MSYYTKITKAGLAAITAAMNNNSKVPITYMAFGDGNGYIPEPDEDASSLVNEVYRVGVNKVDVHSKNPNWLVCEAIIPSAVGGFNIREVALYDSTGNTMLAIASYPPTYKPTVEEGAAKIQTIRIVIQVDNLGNFELIVDPDVVLATIEHVNNIEENLRKNNIFTVHSLINSQISINEKYSVSGFYESGDCPFSSFVVEQITSDDIFEDIGNGILIGSDASIRIDESKKLKIIARETVYLSQLGGVKTAVSTTIKNDVIASVILKNFKELVIDGFYTLRGTIWHDKNNVIRGIGKTISGIRQGDNVNKYPIQSIYSDIKQEIRLNDRLEMYGFTLDGNKAKNGVRNYSKDINFSYWGFGAALFNIDEFYVHDLHVKNTEAWGISYHLCNVVHGENLTFDQVKGIGTNKDGITGSGKRVTYENISGYTDDDLCAVGCGKSSLLGNDSGITVNQEIEYVKINGVEGLKKDGQGAHFAVGIYGPDDAKIKNVVIENVYGSFYAGIIRCANYWLVSSNLNIDNIEINNISKSKLQSSRKNHVFFRYINSKKIVIDGVHYYKDGDVSDVGGGNIIQLLRSNVGTLVSKNIIAEQLNSYQNISVVLAGGSSVDTYVFENISGITPESMPNDLDTSNGCLYLIEKAETPSNSIDIHNINLGGFKLQGYLSNLRYISTNGLSKCINIDNINLPNDDANIIYAADGVSITSIQNRIRNSNLIVSIDALITVSNLTSDMVCFNFGKNMTFKKSTVTVFQPKSAPNGANLVFVNNHDSIKLFNPSFSGLAATGTYRVFLRMVIPII